MTLPMTKKASNWVIGWLALAALVGVVSIGWQSPFIATAVPAIIFQAWWSGYQNINRDDPAKVRRMFLLIMAFLAAWQARHQMEKHKMAQERGN